MKRAIFPGSFDPVTLGHVDLIRRAAKTVDELIVAVLVNHAKNPLFSIDERVSMIEEITRDIPNIKVKSFEGLLVDFAKAEQADLIVRGLRVVTDFEYELQLAQCNRIVNKEVDTIFLMTKPEYACISSSAVREIASYGGDISAFVPASVVPRVIEKYQREES